MAGSAALAAQIHALSQMRVARPGPAGVPVVLDCATTWATPPKQFEAARRHADLPEQLVEFWSLTHELLLFYDVLHGQHGLRLIGPQEAAKATVELVEEWREADRGRLTDALFVIGRFVGDGDRLALNRTTGEVVCLPEILSLDECTVVASSLLEFLTAFRTFAGERYWEYHSKRRLTDILKATGPYSRSKGRN